MILRKLKALLTKDFLMVLRSPHELLSLLLFSTTLFLVFQFSLGTDEDQLRSYAPGLLWMVTLFTSLLFFQKSFEKEDSHDQWLGLKTHVPPSLFFFSKWLTHTFFIFLLQICLTFLLIIFFNLVPSHIFFLILLLGNVGITVLGTFYSALVRNIKDSHLLFPILFYPMMTPLLLAAVKATSLSFQGDLFNENLAWIKLMIVFDTVFLLGSVMLSETLLE